MLISKMKLHIVLVVTIVSITNKASCGVIGNVYDKVSNTTHDVKEDVYSWWTYGVDTVIGEDINKIPANPGADNENESGIIGKLYNKVKGGVSSGYMKVHNFVLGSDSDPNKGIIRTFYERAMNRLSNIKSYIFGDDHAETPERECEIEKEKQDLLKLLFSNRTDIFNTQNEKSALDSLRNKLTQTGEGVIHLADNEKDVLRRAYESVRRKSDDILHNAGESADQMKNKFNEGIERTQEFIQDESKKAKAAAIENFNAGIESTQEFIKDESNKAKVAAKRIGEEVQKSASDIGGAN